MRTKLSTLGTLAAVMVASPALAHHEVVVTAAALGVIPALSFVTTAGVLIWRKWRGK